jgi:hypothetical protein
MTSTASDPIDYVQPPAGAVQVGEWHYAGAGDHARYFEHAPHDIGDAVLTIHGVQYADGTCHQDSASCTDHGGW